MKNKRKIASCFFRYTYCLKKIFTFLLFIVVSMSIYAQTKQINGIVKDTNGKSLIGVTVRDVSSDKGTITDIEGKFTIEIPQGSTSLKFTYMGYKEVVQDIKGKTHVEISMQENAALLDEIVVIGYGVTKKSDLTGSVASVKAEDLERFPTSNVTEMLRGQAAGIQVSLDNSSPGGASKILVRGKRSLSSSQSPLYIVDGMIVPHINDLNSNDISSIEVLKDASSQAIYGSRASNGVILVTTKRGKEGKLSVDVNSYIGFQSYHRNFDLYSPDEFIKLRYWAKHNDGVAGIGTVDNMNIETILDDAMMYDAYQNNKFVDWEDLMLTNAVQQKHDINLRGGNDKFKYSASVGYLDQEGMVLNSGYKRGNFRSNLDYSPLKWLDFSTNLSFSRSEKQGQDGSFNTILTMPQLAQAYDKDGNVLRESTTSGEINPLWRNREYKDLQNDDYWNLSSSITLKPFKDFSYRFNTSLRSNVREYGMYKTKKYPASTGEGEIRNFNRSSYLIENIINYSVPFKSDSHKLQLTLIQSVEQDLQKTTGMDFINSTTDMFDWNVVGSSEITKAIRSIDRTRATSFAARAQYNLLDRYLLTASIRRDGASVFGAENKWANFPSVALAWRINDEQFMKKYDWISMLKARISYGVVGNWAIPSYRTLGIADSYEYLFADQLSVGYLPSNELINKSLKWETTHSVNYGLDFGMWNGRLNGTIEHYNTKTNDLLIRRTIPSITGYDKMWDNLGQTKSSGWEFSLNGDIISTKDFEWNLGASVSFQKNEIVKIDGRRDENGVLINDLNNRWFIGESINVDYNYVFGGIWQKGEDPQPHQYLEGDAKPEPGDIKLVDYNGDGKITTDDRKIYSLDPDWYGSISTSIRYKDFDFMADFYTVQGVTKNNPYLYAFDQGGSLNGKKNGLKVNYWTPDNPSNEAPRPQFTAAVPYFGIIGLQDASYFRFRSATLGYTLPKKLTQKAFIQKARIYATATNIFTITDYKSYSPEKEPGSYPEPKTFTFGVNLSF